MRRSVCTTHKFTLRKILSEEILWLLTVMILPSLFPFHFVVADTKFKIGWKIMGSCVISGPEIKESTVEKSLCSMHVSATSKQIQGCGFTIGTGRAEPAPTKFIQAQGTLHSNYCFCWESCWRKSPRRDLPYSDWPWWKRPLLGRTELWSYPSRKSCLYSEFLNL